MFASVLRLHAKRFLFVALVSSVVLRLHAETVRTIRDGETRMSTSTFTQLLARSLLQCCFTSSETVRTTRDGEPRMSTWTFTQLMLSLLLMIIITDYLWRPMSRTLTKTEGYTHFFTRAHTHTHTHTGVGGIRGHSSAGPWALVALFHSEVYRL